MPPEEDISFLFPGRDRGSKHQGKILRQSVCGIPVNEFPKDLPVIPRRGEVSLGADLHSRGRFVGGQDRLHKGDGLPCHVHPEAGNAGDAVAFVPLPRGEIFFVEPPRKAVERSGLRIVGYDLHIRQFLRGIELHNAAKLRKCSGGKPQGCKPHAFPAHHAHQGADALRFPGGQGRSGLGVIAHDCGKLGQQNLVVRIVQRLRGKVAGSLPRDVPQNLMPMFRRGKEISHVPARREPAKRALLAAALGELEHQGIVQQRGRVPQLAMLHSGASQGNLVPAEQPLVGKPFLAKALLQIRPHLFIAAHILIIVGAESLPLVRCVFREGPPAQHADGLEGGVHIGYLRKVPQALHGIRGKPLPPRWIRPVIFPGPFECPVLRCREQRETFFVHNEAPISHRDDA